MRHGQVVKYAHNVEVVQQQMDTSGEKKNPAARIATVPSNEQSSEVNQLRSEKLKPIQVKRVLAIFCTRLKRVGSCKAHLDENRRTSK